MARSGQILKTIFWLGVLAVVTIVTVTNLDSKGSNACGNNNSSSTDFVDLSTVGLLQDSVSPLPLLDNCTSGPYGCSQVNPRIWCQNKDQSHRIESRAGGAYLVLYNYVRASARYKCNETITFTTHGESR